MRMLLRVACGLLFGLNFPAPAFAAEPMSFFADTSDMGRFMAVTHGGVFDVYASGEIIPGTSERLLAFLGANNIKLAKIHFNSPGGSLVEGIKLGRTIRALQLDTAVGIYSAKYVEGLQETSICASACAYAFAGGSSRFLNEYTGRLGIHQFYSPNNAAVSGETVQQVSGYIVAYLDEMGVDAKAFTLSTTADRDGMIWLTPELALKLRFSNNGVSPPVAEIKLMGMKPYLRIQQEFHDVTTRVLFICAQRKLGMEYGIVTNESTSGMIMSFPKRSYLELDYKEFLPMPGATGAKAQDSVVWIERMITPTTLAMLVRANRIDGWVDGSGAVRWGAQLDMPTIRDKISDFARQCYAG